MPPIYIEFSLIILCLITTPIVIFSIGPETTANKKTLSLLLPIVFYFLFSVFAMNFNECFPLSDNGCVSYKVIFLSIINYLSSEIFFK